MDEATDVKSATDSDRPYWVAFHCVPNVGPVSMRRLREHFGTLEQAWAADVHRLRGALTGRALESLTSIRHELDVSLVMQQLERDNISVMTLADDSYPRLLREIPSPPPVLFYRETLMSEDETAVAVVGTRKVTPYGRAMAEALGAGLAQAGVTVVSGLAVGVDGIAHQAAVNAGGRTIAVLGGGLNHLYPAQHKRLASQIEAQGAVLSDYAPNRKPDGPQFSARNRIISGLSVGVVVVEAAERSGALITVDFAADQGRDVFAVPGPVGAMRSEGCNKLLRDGARLVRSADDILADLQFARKATEVLVQQALPLGESERRILAILTSEPQHIDEICELAALPPHETGAHLLTMELQGLVRNSGAQHYIRARG